MNSTLKTVVFWTVIVVSASLLWQVVRSNAPTSRSPEIPYSTFIAKAQAGEIASVNITGTQILGEYRNGGGTFHLTGPNTPAAYLGTLQDKGVEIRFRDANEGNLPLQLLGTWAPLILLGALWFFYDSADAAQEPTKQSKKRNGTLGRPGMNWPRILSMPQ